MTRDFTATTFIVRDGRTLLLYHKQLRQWLPPGGHIKNNELPCDAAVREVREECGLEVELLSPRAKIGTVDMLSRPECVLLEQISADHQHIDLIYFALVIGGRLQLAASEVEGYRWCSVQELEDEEIAVDIRQLGRMAIETASGRRKMRDDGLALPES